ncbi:MAG: hypothetical protein AAFR98_13535 [Pseudomonadota bacterium]
MKGVPKILFDPADFEAGTGASAWSQLFRFLHFAKPLDVRGRSFSSYVNSYIIDGLIFGQGVFGLQTMEFDEEKDTVLHGEKYLVSWVLQRGRMNILHDGEMLDVGPGEYCLIDQSRQSKAILTDSDVLSVIIPHSTIGYDPSLHPSRVHVDLSAPLAQLLYDDLQTITAAAPTMTRREAPAYGQTHKSLLIDLLEAHASPQSKQTNAMEIRAFVDEQIFSGDVTVKDVMRRLERPRGVILDALGFSPSFEAYIEERRLVYALRSLAFGGTSPDWLQTVARRSGYPSVTEFQVAFEAQFGFEPQTILGVLVDSHAQTIIPQGKYQWEKWYSP